MSNTTTNTTKKAFNPTVTALWENDKFGEGSLLSAEIDAKAFTVIQQSIQLGSKLVIKKSKKLTAKGSVTFFMEILPPMADNGKNNTRRATPSNDDGI